MYHRICERTPETEPYFARGTAVEPQVFRSQLEWLAARCDVVPLAEWRSRRGSRPEVVITFDDGYVDAMNRVAPTCAALGLPWTLFAGPWCSAENPVLLWVDRYYALLGRARHRRDIDLTWLLDTVDAVPNLDVDLKWWVRGPPKQLLVAMDAADRACALERLAGVLGVELDVEATARSLYCSRQDLLSCLDLGVTLGGHGATHARIGDLTVAGRADELAGSQAFLDDLGVPNPRCFAYPDGSFDANVARQVRAAGFAMAMTVEPGTATAATDPLRLPRHIVRNFAPDDPRWCAASFVSGGFPCPA
jgi:peptidoglycan/xylan/chitin deacetylase (PgdA/CDA1 family)